jgi:hypothetical protein
MAISKTTPFMHNGVKSDSLHKASQTLASEADNFLRRKD